ncbi:MAG: TetR/AcrR family transcriptional regulator [Pseudomonadota bacterium]|nr:TetR/AcrR family transcriptional regulator [Pseudomonadota bacterium]
MSRETLLPMLAGYVLENGLADVSLRPLAKAAGTSDRMLLYHFGSKEELVAALLEYLASMYAATLDAAFPDGAATSRRSLAEAVLRTTAQPNFAPFMRVWWDIVAGCADGNAHYLASAGAMGDRLLEWIETHLPTEDPNPVAGARAVLAVIEGAMMLRTIGRGDIGEAGLAALES